MSVDKNKAEAKRWLKTASDDLDTAVILQKNQKFSHSCFHAQ
jgi:HEPN domain-containing protein